MKRSLFIPFLLIVSLSSCQQATQRESGAADLDIHQAAYYGNVASLNQHIAAKADLNAKDQFGSTPLLIATLFGKVEAAKLLIEAGADLQATSADGSTPLHTAAFLCRTELVLALLAAGASTDAKNAYGSTPLASIAAPFGTVKPIYEQMNRDLGPLGLTLDLNHIEKTRPSIANLLEGK